MILIGTDEGIYRWFDGIGWPVYHSLQDRAIRAIAASGGGVVAAVDVANRVLESVDNGMTWRVIPMPDGAGRPSAITVVGPLATLLVGTKPLALQRRLVGGALPSVLTQTIDRARSALRSRREASGGGGGKTAVLKAPPAKPTLNSFGWTILPPPNVSKSGLPSEVRVLAVAPGEPEVWFAALSGSGLWKSTDSGATWSACAGLPAEVFSVRFAPDRVVVATSDGVWTSLDAGTTWTDTSKGLENARHVRVVEIKPGKPDVLLAGAAPTPGASGAAPRDGLKFALYESTDGGKNWASLRRGLPDDLGYDAVSDIRFDPAAPDNVVVALGSGELWISRNGGEYWGPLARQIKSARTLAAFG